MSTRIPRTDLVRRTALLILGVLLASGARAQDDLCIPILGGLAGTPSLDGDVAGDRGWAQATQVNLIDPTASAGTGRDVALLLGKTGVTLHVGLIVDDVTPVHQDNTVVVALSTTTTAAHDWRIHLTPFDTALPPIPSASLTVQSTTFWRDSSGWNGAGATANDGSSIWLGAARVQRKTASRWELELDIPTTSDIGAAGGNGAIFFPASGAFEMYVDVLSTNFLSMYAEAPWPPGSGIDSAASPFLAEATPLKTAWGEVSFNTRPECTGVSIANIGTRNPAIHEIRLDPKAFDPAQCSSAATWTNPENLFFAELGNNTGAAADDVEVTYRIANWGIPSIAQWEEVGPPGTITSGTNPIAGTVPAGGSPSGSTTFEMGWTPTKNQSCEFAQHPHQCILVELDSANPATRFLRRGAARNMAFVSASTFSRRAEIGAQGLPAPPGGGDHHEFLLVSSLTPLRAGSPEGSRPTGDRLDRFDTAGPPQEARGDGFEGEERATDPRLAELLTALDYPRERLQGEVASWTIGGYYPCEGALIINGNRYERACLSGTFGYVVDHQGPFSGWETSLEGPGLRAHGAGMYTLPVPVGGSAVIITTIEAVERGPWSFSVHGGWAWPSRDGFDAGPAFGLDFEYLLTPRFALEGYLGHAGFDDEDAAGVDVDGDLDVWYLSLFFKYYLRPGPPTGFFVKVGPGVYRLDVDAGGSDTEPGAALGLGLQHELTSRLALELTGRYHVVDSDPSLEYAELLASLRLRF